MTPRLKRNLLLLVLIAWAFPSVAEAQFGRQFYSSWKWQKEKERYYAYYYFKPKPNNNAYKRQIIVHYPKHKKKRRFVYYYNLEKKKFWGRCCSRHHPKYDPKVMVWNFAKDAPPGKDWGPLTKGDPPIPGSKGKTGMQMVPNVPDPPS